MDLPGCGRVPVQPEKERGRFPLVSKFRPALARIVSMSPPGYPSAWLHPCRGRFRFIRQNHCKLSSQGLTMPLLPGRTAESAVRRPAATVVCLAGCIRSSAIYASAPVFRSIAGGKARFSRASCRRIRMNSLKSRATNCGPLSEMIDS